jgi:hypothetical protein
LEGRFDFAKISGHFCFRDDYDNHAMMAEQRQGGTAAKFDGTKPDEEVNMTKRARLVRVVNRFVNGYEEGK